MFKFRSIIAEALWTRCIAMGVHKTSVGEATTAIVRASRFSTILSRSRPPANPTSKLPAAWRHLSASSLNDNDVQKRVENISEKFKEAMELLDDARGSVGTVYFSEDMTDAEEAIQEVLSDYDGLMKEMNEDQRRSVVRTIGLKIEELKAQVQMLKESLKD